IDYTINGGAVQTTTLDASGEATSTVANPAVGDVVLIVTNIYNTACNIPLTTGNTHTIVVNPLPTATIVATNATACIGEDAFFTITGTPNATVTYSINGGTTESLTLDGSGNYSLNVPSLINVQVSLI